MAACFIQRINFEQLKKKDIKTKYIITLNVHAIAILIRTFFFPIDGFYAYKYDYVRKMMIRFITRRGEGESESYKPFVCRGK